MPRRPHGIDQLDMQIVRILRNNSRTTLREIAAQTNAPLSTIFSRLKTILSELVIKTSVELDSSKFYPLRAWLWMSARTTNPSFVAYVASHPSYNTLCRTHPGTMFVAEGFFASIKSIEEELFVLRSKGAENIRVNFVVDCIKYEQFIASQD